MDLNAAEMFVAVVRAGSLSAAAVKLRVPLATLSRRIRQFERELNVDRNRDLAVEGLRQLGLSPAELQLINTALASRPNDAQAHNTMGRIFLLQGDIPRAIEELIMMPCATSAIAGI